MGQLRGGFTNKSMEGVAYGNFSYLFSKCQFQKHAYHVDETDDSFHKQIQSHIFNYVRDVRKCQTSKLIKSINQKIDQVTNQSIRK